VTDRGRPVALLVPTREDRWQDLVAVRSCPRPVTARSLTTPRGTMGSARRLGSDPRRRAVRLYLDSSALVKLVQREAESDSLRRFLRRRRGDHLGTSVLARVEVVRAVFAGGPPAIAHARRQLSRLDQVVLGTELLDRAATLNPMAQLRTLDDSPRCRTGRRGGVASCGHLGRAYGRGRGRPRPRSRDALTTRCTVVANEAGARRSAPRW